MREQIICRIYRKLCKHISPEPRVDAAFVYPDVKRKGNTEDIFIITND